MKTIMTLLVLVVCLSACTKSKYDEVSKDQYTMPILIEDSLKQVDTAYIDITTAVSMQLSIFSEGDLIPVYSTPIGMVHTWEHPAQVETKYFLGMYAGQKCYPYPETICRFIRFVEPLSQDFLDAIEAEMHDSVTIDGEKWDLQETGSL
jgi:hypothetical protein